MLFSFANHSRGFFSEPSFLINVKVLAFSLAPVNFIVVIEFKIKLNISAHIRRLTFYHRRLKGNRLHSIINLILGWEID